MPFMDKRFLLKTETAYKLFYDYAAKAPVFDFHCHLSPRAIYENKPFEDITEAWLSGDHYKWRAMRSMGIDESFATGGAPGYEKFLAFVKTLKNAPGNPLYHWAHLELQRFFGVYEPLTEKNARHIYDKVNMMLKQDYFKPRDFIQKSNVRIIFTTDDPADSLEYHEKLKNDNTFGTRVAPAFRPDKLFNTNPAAFNSYLDKLSNAAEMNISSFTELKSALKKRMDRFDALGAKASDHAFGYIPYAEATEDEIEAIFSALISGKAIPPAAADKYKTAVMKVLASEYTRRGWVMELHFGVTRDNNSRMFGKLGPDTGFDSIGDYPVSENLIRLLDSLEAENCLPRTVMFPINPKDYYSVTTIMGSFQSAEDVSKMQFGTAWWFNDHIDGMTYQIKTLANLGVLGRFIGMLTDSRSFLSYPRHEYFRRILCDILGGWVENGEFYAEPEELGQMVTNICYNNAVTYFSQTP